MTHRSELAGSVRPYFGRSISKDTRAIEPPAEAADRAAPVEAATPVDDTALVDETATIETPAAVEATADLASDLVEADSAEDVVRGAARERGWVLVEQPSAVDVVVPVGSDRLQTVTVRFDHRDELARPAIVFSSRCGPISDRNASALLRRNARSFLCAFALEKHDEVEIAVLRGTQPADDLQVPDVARFIEAIAKHADSIERRLSEVNKY